MLRCSIELRRVDILMEVSCLSQHSFSPREGHLDSVYCILIFLKKNLGKNPGRTTCNHMYEPAYKNVFEAVGRGLDECK